MVDNLLTHDQDPAADALLNECWELCDAEGRSTEYMIQYMCDSIMTIDKQNIPTAKMYKRGKYPDHEAAFDYVMNWLTNGMGQSTPDEWDETDTLAEMSEDKAQEERLNGRD